GGPGDYTVDEKTRQAFLTEAGHEKVERLLVEAGLLERGASLYDVSSLVLMHHLNAALRAHSLYRREVDYIVRNNEVIIIDEFTGRMMPGRRWSEGLHQAVEAKEGVPVQNEVVVIPTHRPMIRQDLGDQVYRTTREKHAAILSDIQDCHRRGQPVLVGTASIEASEVLSKILQNEKIPHQVLNAKHH
ncbi:MAG: preprotein translocase subunit SecA, partial [Novosphingobium meiothermophilum]